MESGYNNGGIAPINRVNLGNDAQIDVQRNGNNTNFYNTASVAGANEAVRYQQNYNPESLGFLSKTLFGGLYSGINLFQNNFAPQTLGYRDDGTVLMGQTIAIA